MPNVQNTAMAESSRISFRLLSHSTPKADKTANKAADRMGEILGIQSQTDTAEGGMRQSAADEHQSPGDDVCAYQPASNACQQTADEGMLEKGVLQ